MQHASCMPNVARASCLFNRCSVKRGGCRYFDQPAEVKAKYPSVDWGAVKLLGYEVNRMHEGGETHHPRCSSSVVTLPYP